MKVNLRCNESGLWTIVGHPLQFQDDNWMSGRLLAHDIVEHVNGWQNIGTVEDELQALGAVWHIRGRWGDDGITDESIVNDVINNLRYVTHRELYNSKIRYNKYEIEEFEYIITEIDHRMFQECEYFNKDQIVITKNNIKCVLGWMVMGQRKAKKKYCQINRFGGNNLFHAIERTVNEYNGEPYYQYKLNYCISKGTAQIKKIVTDEYY